MIQKFLPIGLIAIISITSLAQNKKRIDFIGGARSIVQNSNFNTHDSIPDTTTLKKTVGGYALIDLGVAIRPNDKTEIMGMFRIRNDFGGFWGSGVSFDVRQLWLKGILGKGLKYQVGDLNLKQTPFTLYNSHADRVDSLPEVFKIQNNIINYENFYLNNNTWRTQGIAIDFGLTFSKLIKEIDFSGYVNRLHATDFGTTPERLMPGASVDLWILNNLSIGYNITSVVDIANTVRDTLKRFKNTVQTVDLQYYKQWDINRLTIDAELGGSRSLYLENPSNTSFRDKFAFAKANFLMPNIHSNFTLGFLNVGPEFRSIGAQSKDINYNSNTDYYSNYTNSKTTRPISIYDVITNNALYQRTVTSALMPINPVYNNILPYGLATFNRNGVFFKYSYNPKFLQIDFQNYRLNEIIGQGTTRLRQFNSAQLITKFNIKEMVDLKNKLDFSMGVKLDNTWREGLTSLDNIKLKSIQFHVGLDWEVYEDIDILGGFLMQNITGNEFTTDRNKYTMPTYYTNTSYDLKQNYYAIGLRYRFSPSVQLSSIFQQNTYNNQLADAPGYKMGNFMLLFNMTF